VTSERDAEPGLVITFSADITNAVIAVIDEQPLMTLTVFHNNVITRRISTAVIAAAHVRR